jgi:hypothetical protein
MATVDIVKDLCSLRAHQDGGTRPTDTNGQSLGHFQYATEVPKLALAQDQVVS